jgi:hypothetical protein
VSEILRRAAVAFEGDPGRMAAALAAYRTQTGMDEAALAAWLGVDLDRLHGLALCARPARASSPRPEEIVPLAAFVGCDPDRLAALLRAVL